MRKIAVLLVAVAGCAGNAAEKPKPAPDPASSTLEAGQVAITHYNERPIDLSAQYKRPPSVLLSRPKSYGRDSWIPVELQPGVRVRVGYDPGYYLVEGVNGGPRKVYPPDVLARSRPVNVVVLEGQNKGVEGTVDRDDLRPAP